MSEQTQTYQVTGVQENKPCPFCLDGRTRSKEVFEVQGPYTGLCCASHLAILIRQKGTRSELQPVNGQ